MIKIILGTDWWTDCDDAIAIKMLANAHKDKEIEILGISIDACFGLSLVSLDAFLQNYGVTVPIAVDENATDFTGIPGKFQTRLSELPSRFKSNNETEKPVKMYRQLLAASEQKVDIAEIGFPQVLAQLLESEPDEYSNLSGIELVRQKVTKLWMMAGKWDEQGGTEHNFANNNRSRVAAAKVCELWPTPITFLGYEIGYMVKSGKNLPCNDVLKQVLIDHGSAEGRHSWDPMLVLAAIINNEEKAGYTCVQGKAKVDEKTGCNYFTEDKNGNHTYLKKTLSDEEYVRMIDNRIN